MKRSRQLGLALQERFGWGGARVGAGRKASGRSGVEHRVRPELSRDHPVHVTLRLVREVGNARRRNVFRAIREAFRACKDRFEFRLVHYSVQGNHIHLIAEAEDRKALSRGLKGLQVRIAKAINKVIGRSGTVFADRYHDHVLKTPRETRNAIAYVLLNARHHATKLTGSALDPCASGLAFDGWNKPVTCIVNDPPPVLPARTWLMRAGWKKHKLLSPNEIPAPKIRNPKKSKNQQQ